MQQPEREGIDWTLVAVAIAPAIWIAVSVFGARNLGLLQGIILYTHEAGHPIFGILGQFMGAAGGTLMQLLVPLAFGTVFFVRGQRLSAAIVSYWLAASFVSASVYAQDAIDQELPLIHSGLSAAEEMEQFGGTEHDWISMLDMLGWPERSAHGISIVLYLMGAAVLVAGVALGLHAAGVRLPEPAPKKKPVRRAAPRRRN